MNWTNLFRTQGPKVRSRSKMNREPSRVDIKVVSLVGPRFKSALCLWWGAWWLGGKKLGQAGRSSRLIQTTTFDLGGWPSLGLKIIFLIPWTNFMSVLKVGYSDLQNVVNLAFLLMTEKFSPLALIFLKWLRSNSSGVEGACPMLNVLQKVVPQYHQQQNAKHKHKTNSSFPLYQIGTKNNQRCFPLGQEGTGYNQNGGHWEKKLPWSSPGQHQEDRPLPFVETRSYHCLWCIWLARALFTILLELRAPVTWGLSGPVTRNSTHRTENYR